MRPKSSCKIWLRKCVHNTLLVLVGWCWAAGATGRYCHYASAQRAPGTQIFCEGAPCAWHFAKVGCPHKVAAPTRPLLWQRLAACKVWPSHICAKCAAARKSATQLTQMLRQRHPQRLQDFNLQICLLPNWIQIGFLATISN